MVDRRFDPLAEIGVGDNASVVGNDCGVAITAVTEAVGGDGGIYASRC